MSETTPSFSRTVFSPNDDLSRPDPVGTRLGLKSGEQSVGQTQKVTLESEDDWSVSQWAGQWAGQWWRSEAQTDFALLGQLVDDLRLKFGVVDAGLPEGPGVAVLLPVMVPVALLVGAVAKHRHLKNKTTV